MKEVFGTIWIHYPIPDHFICLTTNGTIKKDGTAVMGRGNAKQATIVIPEIPKMLGEYLKLNGNVAGALQTHAAYDCVIIFPVKHRWWEKADLQLIARSRDWLWTEAKNNPGNTYHLPRPGCGNGQRDWETEVKPLIQNLPDNVWVHHLPADPGDQMNCPHCQTPFGPRVPEVQVGARAFCPMCRGNLVWHAVSTPSGIALRWMKLEKVMHQAAHPRA